MKPIKAVRHFIAGMKFDAEGDDYYSKLAYALSRNAFKFRPRPEPEIHVEYCEKHGLPPELQLLIEELERAEDGIEERSEESVPVEEEAGETGEEKKP